jgi:hypothetical protein
VLAGAGKGWGPLWLRDVSSGNNARRQQVTLLSAGLQDVFAVLQFGEAIPYA